MNCLQARLTEHHFWLILKKGYKTKVSIKFLFEVSFRVLGNHLIIENAKDTS